MVLSVSIFACITVTAAPTEIPKSSIINGNFEKSTNGKMPDNWELNVYNNVGTITYFKKTTNSAYVTITSDQPADARIKQLVQLEKSSTYLFTCEIKASGFKETTTNGAVLSVLGQTTGSKSLFDTKDQWVKSQLYIKTSDKIETSYPLTIGIGGHSSLNAGTASFRNVTLKLIKTAVPKDAAIISLSSSTINGGQSGNAVIPESSSSVIWIVIIVGVLLLGGVVYYIFVMRKSTPDDENPDKEGEEDKTSDETVEDEDFKKEEKPNSDNDLL